MTSAERAAYTASQAGMRSADPRWMATKTYDPSRPSRPVAADRAEDRRSRRAARLAGGAEVPESLVFPHPAGADWDADLTDPRVPMVASRW